MYRLYNILKAVAEKIQNIHFGTFTITTNNQGWFSIPDSHRYPNMYCFAVGLNKQSYVTIQTVTYTGYVIDKSIDPTKDYALANTSVTIGYIAFDL